MRVSGYNIETSRLEVSVYNVYITNQFQTNFAWAGVGGGWGEKSIVDVTVNSKKETLKTFVPITSKNSASVHGPIGCTEEDQFGTKYSITQVHIGTLLYLTE